MKDFFFFFFKDFNVFISHFKDTSLYIIWNLIEYIDQRKKKKKQILRFLISNFSLLFTFRYNYLQ